MFKLFEQISELFAPIYKPLIFIATFFLTVITAWWFWGWLQECSYESPVAFLMLLWPFVSGIWPQSTQSRSNNTLREAAEDIRYTQRVVRIAIAVIICLVIFLIANLVLDRTICSENPPPSIAISFLLDTSENMKHHTDTGASRYDIALSAIETISNVPLIETNQVWRSLRIAGGGTDCNLTSLVSSGNNISNEQLVAPINSLEPIGTNGYEVGLNGMAEDFGTVITTSDIRIAILMWGSIDFSPCQDFNLIQSLRVLRGMGIDATLCIFGIDVDSEVFAQLQSELAQEGISCVHNETNVNEISQIVVGIIEGQILLETDEVEVLITSTPIVYVASRTFTPIFTERPSNTPTDEPTPTFTERPSNTPTNEPAPTFTERPSNTPTDEPTPTFTERPSNTPTDEPTPTFTERPSNTLTDEPTPTFTERPSNTPTDEPIPTFTEHPSNTPTDEPSETMISELSMAESIALIGINSNEEWIQIVEEEGYVREFDGIEMVLVPVGCFVLGNDIDSINGTINGGDYCFEEPFWIDRTEVTQDDFARLDGVQSTRSFREGGNYPIDNITWFEASDFCSLRGGYLPSEVEWEYAARGPDELIYPWGNNFIDGNAVYSNDRIIQIMPVGSLPTGVSWVGALDMSGNIWEWTNSLYEDYPYDSNDGREDSTDLRTDVVRVQRGGYFYFDLNSLRAASRTRSVPDLEEYQVGFRCVKTYNE